MWLSRRLMLVALSGMAGLGATATDARAMALIVPAYFSPVDHAAEWARMTTAAARVSVTAIFNPASGPGTASDPTYTSALGAFRAAGGKAIAYVHTQNADGTLRPLASVEAEVDQYRSFYAFDGVFVDEMTSDSRTSHLNFYANLYGYIKAKSSAYVVVGNPGTGVPVAYASVADVLVTTEDFQASYSAIAPEPWTAGRSAGAFANILHDAPGSTLNSSLALAASRNVGNVYFTDDGADGNPYDSLPAYWQAEVNAVAAPEPAAIGVLAAVLPLLAGRRDRRDRRVPQGASGRAEEMA